MRFPLLVLVVTLAACATSSTGAPAAPGVEYDATPTGDRLPPYEGMVLLYGYEGGAPDAACKEVGRVEAPADAAGNLPALALRKAAQSLGGNGVKDIERDPTSRSGRIWFVGTAVRCP